MLGVLLLRGLRDVEGGEKGGEDEFKSGRGKGRKGRQSEEKGRRSEGRGGRPPVHISGYAPFMSNFCHACVGIRYAKPIPCASDCRYSVCLVAFYAAILTGSVTSLVCLSVRLCVCSVRVPYWKTKRHRKMTTGANVCQDLFTGYFVC